MSLRHGPGSRYKAGMTTAAFGRSPSRSGRWLYGAALTCLVAGGLLLWWQHGETLFAELAAGALAWCL